MLNKGFIQIIVEIGFQQLPFVGIVLGFKILRGRFANVPCVQ